MTEVMSNLMHETLLKSLLSNNSPVTIILDGGTDDSRRHSVIVYFLAIEDYTPIMYFFKLVECSIDQSANGMFEALKTSFSQQSRDLTTYLRNNLIGYISDGAPVMIGKNSLLTKFRSLVNQPVYSVHCMAHKLHLAITQSIKNFVYFHIGLEKIIDSLVRFYHFHSSKRAAHLVKTSTELKIKLHDIHFISSTRWITSEFKILTSVKKNWFVYIIDLMNISKDNKFNREVQDKANSYYNILIEKKTV